jgi:hypothetical protein
MLLIPLICDVPLVLLLPTMRLYRILEIISNLPLWQLAFNELTTSNLNNLPATTQDTMNGNGTIQDDDNYINSQLEALIAAHEGTVENKDGSKVGVETKVLL